MFANVVKSRALLLTQMLFKVGDINSGIGLKYIPARQKRTRIKTQRSCYAIPFIPLRSCFKYSLLYVKSCREMTHSNHVNLKTQFRVCPDTADGGFTREINICMHMLKEYMHTYWMLLEELF